MPLNSTREARRVTCDLKSGLSAFLIAGSRVVETASRQLTLCEDGSAVKRYPSERFHIFIPVGYPTLAQRQEGYTGQDVGLPGPTRHFRWAGRINNRVQLDKRLPDRRNRYRD